MFLQLNRLASDALDKRQTFELVSGLAKPYPKSPKRISRWRSRRTTAVLRKAPPTIRRLEEVENALALKPDWERAALLKSGGPARGRAGRGDGLSRAFSSRPTPRRARPPARSRSSTSSRSATPRRARSSKALGQRPQRARVRVRRRRHLGADEGLGNRRVALLRLKARRLRRQRRGRALSRDRRGAGRFQEAIDRYKAVPEGDRAWLAKLRIAAMMGKLGKVADGRRYLADLPAVTIDQRVQVRQAEAQLLRDANDNAAAYAVLMRREGPSGFAGTPLRHGHGGGAGRQGRRSRGRPAPRGRVEARRCPGAQRIRLYPRRPHPAGRPKAMR